MLGGSGCPSDSGTSSEVDGPAVRLEGPEPGSSPSSAARRASAGYGFVETRRPARRTCEMLGSRPPATPDEVDPWALEPA